jgi:hypothetical protein
MDGRTGFSIALLLLGGLGMAALFSGKFKNIIAAWNAPGDVGWQADAGQAGAGASASGSFAGANTTKTQTNTSGGGFGNDSTGDQIINKVSLTTGPYSVPVSGTDGLAIAPFGVGS